MKISGITKNFNKFFLIILLLIVIFFFIFSSASLDDNIYNIEVKYGGMNKKIDQIDIDLMFLMFHPDCIDYFYGTDTGYLLKNYYYQNKEKIDILYNEYKKFAYETFKIDISMLKRNYEDPILYYSYIHHVKMSFLSPFIDFINDSLDDPVFEYIKFTKNQFISQNFKVLSFPENAEESLLTLNFLIYLRRNSKKDILDFSELKYNIINNLFADSDILKLEDFIKNTYLLYLRNLSVPPNDVFFDDSKADVKILGYGISHKVLFNFHLAFDSFYISHHDSDLFLPLNKYSEKDLYFYLGHELTHRFIFGVNYAYTKEQRAKISGDLKTNYLNGRIIIPKNSPYNNVLKYYEIKNENKEIISIIKDKKYYFYFTEIMADLAGQIFCYSVSGKIADIFEENSLTNVYEREFFKFYPKYLSDVKLFYKDLKNTVKDIKTFTEMFYSLHLKKILNNNNIYCCF